MGCGNRSQQAAVSITSSAATNSDSFVPASTPVMVSEVDKADVSFEVQSRTANLSVRAAVRYSDDGVNWGTATALGTAVTSTGWTYLGLNSVTSSGAFLQFGFVARNSTGSQPERGTALLRLQFRS